VTVFAHAVEPKEGWFDMGFKKILNAVSPVASVINKSGPVAKILGMKKEGVATPNMGGGFRNIVNAAQAQNALEEGRARVAPVKAPGMKKGGAVKKTKAKSRSASSRGDGICRKGKTRGKIC
jgi:hypothetical protein